MNIRDARTSDAATIADIYNDAVLTSTASFDVEPKPAEDRERWLVARSPIHPVLIAEIDGTVAGWGALSPYSDRRAYAATAELSTYIAAPYRSRGVGRALTLALIERARLAALHMLLARICTENEASIALVRTLGFIEVGTMHEVGWKFDRWLDIVTWEYDLDDPRVEGRDSGDTLR
ncbi:MAG: N-acetyltransferase family protein [Coriobacteriia bacterium]|nr:N-acetyltransferase family protein [Coriobacteriia bacterium]